jgi:hypothetical protein
MRYDVNGAGGGGGTHPSGLVRVRRPGATGLGVFSVFFFARVFLGAAGGGFDVVMVPGIGTTRSGGTEELGGNGSLGRDICTFISSGDRHSRPQCSIM